MSAKRRGVRIGIVLFTAALAACLGPALSSTEQLAVVFSTADVQFPTTSVGSLTSQSIIISPATGNVSSFDMITSVVESCADFSVEGPVPAEVSRICMGGGGPLPEEPMVPNDNLGSGEAGLVCWNPVITVAEYTATFQPLTPGSKSCSVTFTGTFGTRTVLLTGQAQPAPLSMRVQPASINFGDVRVGVTSAPSMITIENTGSSPLSLNAAMGAGAAFALGSGAGAHTLAAGAAETLAVTCQPPDTTLHMGSVTVSAANVAPVTVPLRCQGTSSSLVPSPQIAQLVTRQHEPRELDIRIQNVGLAAATITSYAVTGAEVALVSGGLIGSLGGGEITTARVRYAATTAQASAEIGELVITHDGGTNRIAIMGEAKPTEVSVRPAVIDFDAICAGTPAEIDVTVSAALAGGFELASIGAPAPFTLEAKPGTTVPGAAEGGERNVLEFTARYDGSAVGSQAGMLVVRTDAPMAETKEVVMSAEVLPPGVSATPPALDFGAINALTPGRRVKLTNCDGAPLTVTGARIEGPNAAQFGIADPADPRMTIEPAASGELLLVMSPGAPGGKQAQLVIEHSAGTTTVDLTGATIGAGEASDRLESYYDCSAGGGGAALPVGLAVLAIALPRRRRRAPSQASAP